MELIIKLITIALEQCNDLCVIDWHPEDGIPNSFQGECEIECNKYIPPWKGGDYFVILFGVFCIIDEHLECWHASKLETEELAPPTFAQGACPNCGHDFTAHSAWIANPGDTTCIEVVYGE